MMVGVLFLLFLLASFVAGDVPEAPTKVSYTDTTIGVKWPSIYTSYSAVALEMSVLNTSNFIEIYRGVERGYSIGNLSPLTLYYFRIKYVGIIDSSYSPVTMISTSGMLDTYIGKSVYEDGAIQVEGVGDQAVLVRPRGMAWDPRNSDFYFSTFQKIRKADTFGETSLLDINSPSNLADVWGAQQLQGVALDPINNVLFLADQQIGDIISISLGDKTWKKILKKYTSVPDSGKITSTIEGLRYDVTTETLYFSEDQNSIVRKWPHPLSTPTSNIRTLLTVSLANDPLSYAFDFDSKGNLYVPSGNLVYQRFVNGSYTTFAGTPGTLYSGILLDGPNAKFSELEGVTVASDDSIYVADYGNYVVRRITKEGVTATVVGRPQSTTYDFMAGTGDTANFCGYPAKGPAEILAHPRVPKFFFIADNCGIRVLYGTAPPIPSFWPSVTSNSRITLQWNPIIPSAAISSVTCNIVYRSIFGMELTASSTVRSNFAQPFTFSGLKIAPNSAINISLFASNRYGDGGSAQQLMVSNPGPRAPSTKQYGDTFVVLSLDATKAYNLQRSSYLADSSFTTIFQGTVFDTVYNVTDLNPLSLYYFRIQWINTPDIYSNISSFTTSGTVVSFFDLNSDENETVRGMTYNYATRGLYFIDSNHIGKVNTFGELSAEKYYMNIMGTNASDLRGITLDNHTIFVSDWSGYISAISLDSGESRTIFNSRTSVPGFPLQPTSTRHPAALKYEYSTGSLYFVDDKALRRWVHPLSTSTNTITTNFNMPTANATYSFDGDSIGGLWFAVDNVLYKIKGQQSEAWAGGPSNTDQFNSLTGVASANYLNGPVYVCDGNNGAGVIKQISTDVPGTVNVVVGATGKQASNVFVPGSGSDVRFCGDPVQIIAHPESSNSFFISDGCGVRFLYGSPPPPPTFSLTTFNFTLIAVQWTPKVPANSLTSVNISVSFRIPFSVETESISMVLLPPYSLNASFPVELPFDTNVSVSIEAQNKYGSGLATQIFFTPKNNVQVIVKNETRYGAKDGSITFESLPQFYQIELDETKYQPGAFVFTGLGDGNYYYEIWHSKFGPVQNGYVMLYTPPDCSVDNAGCDKLTECAVDGWNVTCGPCPSGYRGSGYTTCIDIDECAEGLADCDKHATCTNTPGSFVCTCFEDYTGNGTFCEGIDCDAACIETGGGECCPDGCRLSPEDTICRAAAGICDLEERCDGNSSQCPPDLKQDYTYICRPAALQYSCDIPDVCGTSLKAGLDECGVDIRVTNEDMCHDELPFYCGDHICTDGAREETCSKCSADCGMCINQQNFDCKNKTINGPNCDLEMYNFKLNFQDQFSVLVHSTDPDLRLLEFGPITLLPYDGSHWAENPYTVEFDANCSDATCSSGTWYTGIPTGANDAAFVRARVDTLPDRNKIIYSMQVFNWEFDNNPTRQKLRVTLPVNVHSTDLPEDWCTNATKAENGENYMLFYNGEYGFLAEYQLTLTIDSQGIGWNFTTGTDYGTLQFDLPYFLSYASFEIELSLVKRPKDYCLKPEPPSSRFSVIAIALGASIILLGVILLIVFVKNCKNMKYHTLELEMLVKAVTPATTQQAHIVVSQDPGPLMNVSSELELGQPPLIPNRDLDFTQEPRNA